MSMNDDTSAEGATADAEARGRGRPSIAELQDRKAALDAREEELNRRALEIELAAAESNQAMRERDIQNAEAKVAAGRSTVRTGSIRSADITEPVRGRKYRGGSDMPNKFHVPQEAIPLGSSYQWNNHTIFGQEQHATNAYMQAQGWEPVPASRHPHLMPPNTDPKSPIIVDGQILVERPAEWTQEALQEEYDKARGEVRMKEEQLYGTPQGQLPRARANGSSEFIQVNKAVEPGMPSAGNYNYETPGIGSVIIE